MNTEENKPIEAIPTKPISPVITDDTEVSDAIEFLKENGVAIVVGAVIAVAAFVGYSAWQNSKVAQEETALTMLANSQTAPQFQEIINNYGETKAAPLAQLSLAASYFDQGQYDLAGQTFKQFETTYPDHELLPVAILGNAQVLESIGNGAEALTAYDGFITRYPEHYQIPTATFGKARVMEIMGRFDDARAVYEDFIANHPESRWIARAETGLDFVNKQQRAALNPTPAPTVNVAPIVPVEPVAPVETIEAAAPVQP
jgi:predicted negative regulator of RcsB-dependent stress response